MAKKLGPQQLTPQATVQRLRLATPDTSKFERLARSLDEFGSNVTGLVIKREQGIAEKEEKAGTQAAELALAEGRAPLDDAEATGLITRGQHPFFKKGVFTAMGRAKADAFGNALSVAYGEQVDAETITPEDVDGVISSVAAEFNTDADNGAMLAGFADVAARHAQRLRDAHAGIVASNMQKVGDEALQANYMADLRRLSEFTGPDRLNEIASLALATQAKWIETLGRNITRKDKTDMNDALVDSVELLLSEDGGEFTGNDAKEFLTIMRPGTDALLNVPKYNKQILKAIRARATREQVRMNNEATNEARARAKIGAEVNAEFASSGYSQEGFDLLEKQVATMNDANPGTFDPGFVARARQDLLAFETARHRDVPINRVVDDALLLGFMEDEITTTADQIKNAAIDGDIPHDRALSLIGMLKTEKESRAKDPRMNRIREETSQQLKGALGGFTPTAITEQAFLRSRRKMFQATRVWAANNPDLDETSDEYEAFLQPLIKGLMQEFMPDHRAAMRPIDTVQRRFLIREFTKTDMGLPVDRLIDLYAQNILLSNPSNDFEANDDYYDFFLADPELGLSEWDVGNNQTTRAAILAQLRLGKIDITEKDFLEALQTRTDQLKTLTTVRSTSAPQAATAGSLSVQQQEAAAMGLTPAEFQQLIANPTPGQLQRLHTVADSLARN